MSRDIDVILKMQGGRELLRKLRKLEPQFAEEMRRTLPAEGERLMDQANALAPVGSGELKASAAVGFEHEADGQGHRTQVFAAYWDDKAAAVHEGIHWERKVEGTKGFKWYERAFNAFERGFVERVATQLRRIVSRAAGGGGGSS